MDKFKKTICSFILMTLISTVLGSNRSLAAASSLYSYALAHPNLVQMESEFPKNLSVHLVKIEQVASYRCPNCFDFKLTYSGYKGKKPIKFNKILQVRSTPENAIDVTVLKP